MVLTLPREQTPLLRLEFDHQATAEQRELARRYWMPKLDGGWAERVADLGPVWRIASDVEKVCTAYLLNVLCLACAVPMSVANRSAAVALGGQDLSRPEAQRMAGNECVACRRARWAQQKRAEWAALEHEREAEGERRRALAGFFQRGGFVEPPGRWERRVLGLGSSEDEEPLDARVACLLHSLIRHARTGAVLPAPNDTVALPVGWLYPAADVAALLERLFQRGWIRVDASAETDAFVFSDAGEVRSFYLGSVPYRLTTSAKTTLEDLTGVLLSHSAQSHMEGIRREIRELEVFDLYLYLNLLLAQDYRYPWVPETKRLELYEQLARGLEHFSFGQMVCLCWRAVDTAASWKERKGLTAAHASSAAVTTLGGKIDYAIDHPASPLKEYKTPQSHLPPPGLAAAKDLLERLETLREEQRGCHLHELHPIPCTHCLGMLYGGGEEAEEVRAHFAELGEQAVVIRPDLGTKRAMWVVPESSGT
ncbi:hypothetical protein [Nocardiopsis sp. JB363]|uniref:hypothetical protein n=1 Tax=Nocardiopsis sp. JB363 TaxID=1434837 RepID=UPI00097A6F7F|nr:hypothetical protein [Nocardiopsis sp. JB363]SIO90961.1 hypothetical protein BQ8420_29340 [Nocardiopsis sp. JB363]